MSRTKRRPSAQWRRLLLGTGGRPRRRLPRGDRELASVFAQMAFAGVAVKAETRVVMDPAVPRPERRRRAWAGEPDKIEATQFNDMDSNS